MQNAVSQLAEPSDNISYDQLLNLIKQETDSEMILPNPVDLRDIIDLDLQPSNTVIKQEDLSFGGDISIANAYECHDPLADFQAYHQYLTSTPVKSSTPIKQLNFSPSQVSFGFLVLGSS